MCNVCLLYTSDAADERSSVDLGGRRIIKKKKYEYKSTERIESDRSRTEHDNVSATKKRIALRQRDSDHNTDTTTESTA